MKNVSRNFKAVHFSEGRFIAIQKSKTLSYNDKKEKKNAIKKLEKWKEGLLEKCTEIHFARYIGISNSFYFLDNRIKLVTHGGWGYSCSGYLYIISSDSEYECEYTSVRCDLDFVVKELNNIMNIDDLDEYIKQELKRKQVELKLIITDLKKELEPLEIDQVQREARIKKIKRSLKEKEEGLQNLDDKLLSLSL
ncbi:hypothetical protein KO493_12590 [Tamlana agarivorans]|uniref:Uncharacterized protein n=1 Tax=Pseudotamlana agarivorans TaxID=481183 RepID=A0ACC5UB63_9FLAO|nr:hypothetical protein [Tamlana agarivorans]MBU2951536.1 hypothetical protein [Tamlana agarivorans]